MAQYGYADKNIRHCVRHQCPEKIVAGERLSGALTASAQLAAGPLVLRWACREIPQREKCVGDAAATRPISAKDSPRPSWRCVARSCPAIGQRPCAVASSILSDNDGIDSRHA